MKKTMLLAALAVGWFAFGDTSTASAQCYSGYGYSSYYPSYGGYSSYYPSYGYSSGYRGYGGYGGWGGYGGHGYGRSGLSINIGSGYRGWGYGGRGYGHGGHGWGGGGWGHRGHHRH